jgi:hypothetical protein
MGVHVVGVGHVRQVAPYPGGFGGVLLRQRKRFARLADMEPVQRPGDRVHQVGLVPAQLAQHITTLTVPPRSRRVVGIELLDRRAALTRNSNHIGGSVWWGQNSRQAPRGV